MSKTIEEKILAKMEVLSNLKDEIEKLVEKYNLLSVQADNDTRLALLIASSNKDDFDGINDNENECDDNLEYPPVVTHEEFVSQNGAPRPHIFRGEARAWFPSSIC